MKNDPPPSSSSPLVVWREAIVTLTLRFVSVAGVLWFVTAVAVVPELRASLFGLVYLSLLFTVWGATLLPRLPLAWRVVVLLVFCYGTALAGLCYAGVTPASALLWVLVILLATLQWGLPVGLAAIGLLVVTWVGVTVAWTRGLPPPPDARLSLDPHFANIWIRQGIAVVFVSVLIVLVVNTAVRWLIRHAASVQSAAAAQRESEERFRLLVETIAEVFWVIDLESENLIYVSPSFERVWGRACADLYRSTGQWVEALHPDDRERMVKVARSRQSTDGYDEIYRIIRPDRTVRWIRDRAFPVRNKAGRAVRCVGVAEDITERMDLEERLLHSQRLESIGTLASGVAHDLNNILTPLLMASNMLQEKLTDPADIEMVSLVEREARRGALIVNQLLTFGRGAAGRRMPVQPRKLLQELVHIMRETFPRNIRVVEEAGADLWVVEADATQLHQVLLNLCLNARDAMPNGGTLTLRAENIEMDGHRSSQNPWAKGGPHVVLMVSDTGHGIPPEIIGRIFDPFFTTKGVGQGSGLGLSTVHGIVRSYDGFVTVKSQVDQGTTFRVFLPVMSKRAPVPEVSAEVRAQPGQGELIMVVDDERSVLAVTRRILEKKGYRVLAASNGEEALAALKTRANEVRLVITDMMMPGLDGAALVPLLRGLAPTVKIIGVSGLDQQHRAAQLAALGFSEILLKPYELTTLLNAVQRQLPPGA